MKKVHRYLRRKKDNQKVRVIFKFGKETVYAEDINKKYLIPSNQKSGHRITKTTKHDIENMKPVPISKNNLQALAEHPKSIVDKELMEKGSVPFSFAIMDMKTLDAFAKYENGRVIKDRPKKSYLSEGHQNLTESYKTLEDSSDDQSSAAPCSSDSNTIIYLSDMDMDLDGLYEDVKPQNPESEDMLDADQDSDDGEITVVKTFLKHDIDSVRRRIEEGEGSKAALDIERIMRVKSWEVKQEPLAVSTEPEQPMESTNVITRISIDDDSDISDAETVVLDTKKGDAGIDNRLDDFHDDETVCDFGLDSEETYTFNVDDKRHTPQKLEPEDEDIYIINDENDPQGPKLSDYLMEAVVKYMEDCDVASKGIVNNNNNNENFNIGKELFRNRDTRISNLKNSSKYNEHLKNALQTLGITITPPALIKENRTFH